MLPHSKYVWGGWARAKGNKKMEEGYIQKYIGIKQAVRGGYIKCLVGGVADFSYPTSELRRGRVQGGGHICPTISTTTGVCKVMDSEMIKEKMPEAKIEDYLVGGNEEYGYGIFKLTTRELGRLQGVTDEDIDSMMEENSNTQCMKQFGNSICVSVLMAIFSQLNIKGVKAWNDATEDENYDRALRGINHG